MAYLLWDFIKHKKGLKVSYYALLELVPPTWKTLNTSRRREFHVVVEIHLNFELIGKTSFGQA